MIEFAPTKKIKQFERFALTFSRKIFGIKNFLITDESSIYDFDFEFTKDKIYHDTNRFLKKIKKVYGVDVSEVDGLNLHKIFEKILKDKNAKNN